MHEGRLRAEDYLSVNGLRFRVPASDHLLYGQAALHRLQLGRRGAGIYGALYAESS